jgi:hypothetical protein
MQSTPIDEPNVAAATPSLSKIARNNIVSPVKKGIQLTEEVETPSEPLRPHIALDKISIPSGYDRIRLEKGDLIIDPYTIAVLLKAGAPIALADGKTVSCPQCKHVFGL